MYINTHDTHADCVQRPLITHSSGRLNNGTCDASSVTTHPTFFLFLITLPSSSPFSPPLTTSHNFPPYSPLRVAHCTIIEGGSQSWPTCFCFSSGVKLWGGIPSIYSHMTCLNPGFLPCNTHHYSHKIHTANCHYRSKYVYTSLYWVRHTVYIIIHTVCTKMERVWHFWAREQWNLWQWETNLLCKQCCSTRVHMLSVAFGTVGNN